MKIIFYGWPSNCWKEDLFQNMILDYSNHMTLIEYLWIFNIFKFLLAYSSFYTAKLLWWIQSY